MWSWFNFRCDSVCRDDIDAVVSARSRAVADSLNAIHKVFLRRGFNLY